MKKIVFLLFAAAYLYASSTLFAQVGTELAFTLQPEFPRPGEAFTVYLESYNIDLDRAEIRWYQNDKLVKTAVGDKRFDATASRGGELLVIRATALAENGLVYSKDLSLRPAEVNLLWQADSYTPPFYKGKALMPFQGTVLLAALPTFSRGGASLPPDSLIYTWQDGDKIIGDSSGKGRSLFIFRGTVPVRPKTISVTVESPDHSMMASASITVVPVSPRILFYEEHPRFGLLLGKALIDRFSLATDETRISAVPYYFETAGRSAKNIEYSWELNYGAFPNEKGSSIALRRTTSAAGESVLFLEARHTDENRSFQLAEKRLTIDFPEQSPFAQ